MDKITLSELADALAKHKSLSKRDAEAFVREVFEIIRENLFEDGLVKVKGLGTFKQIQVESRESVHVNTGERIVIDSHSKITFTPDKTLSDCVNRPFAAFETMILNDETSTEEMERIDMPEQTSEVTDASITMADSTSLPEGVETASQAQEVVDEAPVAISLAAVKSVVDESQPVVKETTLTQPEEPVSMIEESDSKVVEEPLPTVMQEPVLIVTQEPEPIVTQEPQSAPTSETASKRGHGRKIAFWIVFFLLIGGCAYWLYLNKDTDSDAKETTVTPEVVADETVAQNAESENQEEPSEEAEAKNSTAEVQPKVAASEASPADIEKLAADYPQIENGEYWITGVKTVHVLEKGEDLSVLAKKYYDDKRLISYIIRMNHYTNSQASNLFVGAEVKIPELVKK